MHAIRYNTGISDLRERAVAVMRPDVAGVAMSARITARCLSGVISHVARRFSIADMQHACGELVRYDPAWSSSFGQLPRNADGRVPEALEIIAVVARGILPIAGADNMRAALSFWACETDPAVWASVTGA